MKTLFHRCALSNIQDAGLRGLFTNKVPLIDVRAPVEFQQGALPGAVNLPIMDNEERALVGTAYKNVGREKAIELGHSLVSGEVKESRLQAWREQIRRHPETVIYCFRGGLRSQITQRWLHEAGVDRPVITGGYKKARQFLLDEIEQFSNQGNFLILTGPTGSAKTHLLKQASEFYPAMDLEALAHHRGSAFGAWDIPQPSQKDFENHIGAGLIQLRAHFPQGPALLEDESRMIGQRTLPESFFLTMRASPVLYVNEKFEQRVENIFADYVLGTALVRGPEAAALQVFARYRASIEAISRRLGGLRAQEVLQDMAFSEAEYRAGRGLEANKEWIRKLLLYYYDPLYLKSFEKREPKVLHRGPSAEILGYLRSLRAGC